MKSISIEASPQTYARIAGLSFVVGFVIAIFSQAFLSSLVMVPGDPAATATNILNSESLYRLTVVGGLISLMCSMVTTVLCYELFKAVNGSISLLAVFFSLTACAIGSVGEIFYFAPMLILQRAEYLSVFKPEQLQSLAFMFLKLWAQTTELGMAFFGTYYLLIGYLVFRSTFLPRIIGVPVAIGGFCLLIRCFATLGSPEIARYLGIHILDAAFLGSGLLYAWLIMVGVNVQKWKTRSAHSMSQT